LKNKIGVTTDRVTTGAYSDVGNSSRPMTNAEKMYIQKEVERAYEAFTSKAATGRRMSVENLKKIASGRVWTGIQGKENGLVDVLGGLDVALEIAAKKAKITGDYVPKFYPQEQDFFNKIFNKSVEEAKIDAMKAEMGDFYQYYKQIKNLKYLEKGIQARMEYNLIIR
jgi:protease IV